MPSALIEHGDSPDYDLIDETGIVMKSSTWKPERDLVQKKDSNDQTIFLSYRDPRLTLDFSGVAVPNGSGDLQGLAVVHPGTAQTLANWGTGASWHQFTFATGNKMVITSIQTSLTEEKEPEISGSATFWPGIANADLDGATS